MSDLAESIEGCAAAWRDEDWSRLGAAAAALGLRLEAATAKELDALLSVATGNRKSRVLTRADLLAVLAEARVAPEGLAQRHAGLATVSKMITSVALAVRHGQSLTVGVTTTGAVVGAADRAPAWRAELQPWKKEPAQNVERAVGWAKRARPDRVTLRIAPLAEPASIVADPGDGASLHRAVLAAPDDDAPRRVYADWLLSRGDPLGELITLQCELTALDAGPRRAEIEARVAALLRAHEPKWTAALRPLASAWGFRRGLVESVTLKPRVLLERSEVLFALAPIREVNLHGVDAEALTRLATAPQLARLTALSLSCEGEPRSMERAFVAFVASAHLRGLRSLSIGSLKLGPAGVGALADSGLTLRSLELFGCQLGAKGAAVLSAARALGASLEVLGLAHNGLTDAGVAALAGSAAFPRVRELRLGTYNLNTRGAVSLAASSSFPALETLRIGWNGLWDAGLIALMGSKTLTGLTTLDISNIKATPKGLAALAQSKNVARLRSLDISSNKVGEAGARALLDSPHLGQLRQLKCAAAGMKKSTVAELTRRYGREASTG